MADVPIYEDPNGRRRRPARSKNELREGLQDAKQFYIDNGAIDNGFRFNTIEHMFLRTGGVDPVKAPWSDGTKFSYSIGLGRNAVIYDYDSKELESFIQETARIIKEDYGLDNINVRTVLGTGRGADEHTYGEFTWDTDDPNINHIDIYTDEIWKDYGNKNGRFANQFVEGGGIENVKEKIKETLAHEMRHQWQHTTETGKAIEEANTIYENTKINNYTNEYDKYYNKPVEVDARYHGTKFRKSYDLKAKKYKERLNNPEVNKKIEEINLRPKNRIIGHRPDTVEPIEWDIDTGSSTPTGKHDVSRNTRYKNAKLNRGQSSLRPRVTKQGNSMDFDSVHNYKAPHKTVERQRRKPQSRSRTFQADDGSRVKQYLDKNGNVRAQVREWDDGRREVRRQHTAKTVAKDPLAKNMSAALSIYDGETTEIHKHPNGDYFSTTKINHQTGEVVTTRNKRNHKWGGGIMGSETVRTTIDEKRKAHDDYMKQRYGLEDAPEPYTPTVGDNLIESETGERYVLSEIDKADPSLDIYNDTYYYNSPNGGRIVTQKPIDPNDPNGGYWLDDEYLTPDDVKRINNSFEDLRTQTDALEKAQGRLSSLKDDYANGNGDLNEIYEAEKAVRSLEEKVANTKHQINVDDRKFNDPNSPNHGYSINEKTQKNMDKAETLLNDYRSRKHQTIDDVFNDSMPRQFINTIEPGVDSAFELINNTGVDNNIKARTRTRGKKKNAQLTGRGNKKRLNQGTGRSNKNIKPKGTGRKPSALKKRGKSSKLRAVGRNGKVLTNIPRKAIPLNKKDIIKTAANLMINEAATNTANAIIKNVDDIHVPEVDNAPHPDSANTPSADNPVPEPDHSNTPDPEFEVPDGYSDDPTTWTDEDIEDMADGDADLYEELKKRRDDAFNTDTNTPNVPNQEAPETNSGPQGEPIPPKPFSDGFDPNDPDSWTRDDIERMNNPSIWTNDDIKRLADGDMDYTKELLERRRAAHKGLDSGPKQGPDDFRFDTDDAPIPNRNKVDTPDTKMFDEDGIPQGLSKMDIAMTGLNILGAIGDYKDARRRGHGVISSAVRAGAKFAIDEALGWWALPIGIVKTLPGVAIKGADMLYKENRRMNSAANFQVFGDAQFMDTQQLATMRQSGMEMAKMAQYNLQQTLMGSEAKYLHR